MATTKPHYHLMGGLHSGETGPSEMLMELVYRLATETSPLITQIRNNVYVSITPVAEPDGRDRNVDWFYRGLETAKADSIARGGKPAPADAAARRAAVAADAAARAFRTGASTSTTTTTATSTSRRSRCARSPTGTSPRIRRSCTTCTRREPLMYTYSGGPPQNPNLDPILFAELPFFANWELSQMTKWGMPGVYTYAFMDGWSPGYLGSVAYNHNGMMRMYETQSGREGGSGTAAATVAADSATGRGGRGVANAADSAAGRGGRGGRRADAAGRGGRGGGRGGRGGGAGGAAATVVAAAAPAGVAGRGAGAPGGGRGGRGGAPAIPTGRGGGQPREWYRGLPIPPNAMQNFTRRDNTNYMETGVLSALQLTSMFPELVLENFYIKTRNSLEAGAAKAPYGYVFPVQRDMTQGRDARQHPARPGHRGRQARRAGQESAPRRSRRAPT